MIKTLTILAVASLLPAVASADTTLDLLSDLSSSSAVVTSTAFSSGITSVTASTVTTWLSDQNDGVYVTALNGASSYYPTKVTLSDSEVENSYTLAYTIRGGYGAGSVIGIQTSISGVELDTVTSLTLSYTDVNTALSSSITLVYQVDGEWVSKQVSISTTEGGSVTVDLSGSTLSSSTVYAVLATSQSKWTETSGTISLTATANGGAVPEPATASLSLLGLGALLLRRRRH